MGHATTLTVIGMSISASDKALRTPYFLPRELEREKTGQCVILTSSKQFVYSYGCVNPLSLMRLTLDEEGGISSCLSSVN